MRELEFRAWLGDKMQYNVVPFQWDYVLGTTWHKCIRSTGNGVLGSGGREADFEVGGFSIRDGGEIMQYTGLKDKNGVDIYEGDIVEFYVCYTTTQTHTGDNIPNGSYTEPDETILAKIKGDVYYNEDIAAYSYNLIGQPPYNFFQERYEPNDQPRPIIGRNQYELEEIKSYFFEYASWEEEWPLLLEEYGFKDDRDFMAQINSIEVIGNIYESALSENK